MKIAFFSDTHGTLLDIIADYDFSGVELCVFCGDCYESDFAKLKHLNIPKIGIEGNHPTYEGNNLKRDVFKEYGIIDISWREFEFKGVKFPERCPIVYTDGWLGYKNIDKKGYPYTIDVESVNDDGVIQISLINSGV